MWMMAMMIVISCRKIVTRVHIADNFHNYVVTRMSLITVSVWETSRVKRTVWSQLHMAHCIIDAAITMHRLINLEICSCNNPRG